MVSLKYFQDQAGVWFSLARLPTESARVFFPSHSFPEDETAFSFSFLLFVPVQCLDKTFLSMISLLVTENII